MTARKQVVVLGIGNTLMSDEGIGVYVVRELMSISDQFSHVDFLELGSSMMGVVHAIAGRKKAIVVDCAYMHEPAGSIRKFTPESVFSEKKLAGLSMHEGDLLHVLELSRRLNECPEQIVIFGIQPEKVEPGNALSERLNSRLKNYAKLITAELDV